MVGLDITIPTAGTETQKPTIINLYSLEGEPKTGIRGSYHIPKKSNSILVGDFNTYNLLWYGSRPIARAYTYPCYTMEVDKLVKNITARGYKFLGRPGCPIHFLYNETSLSILDLAFTQGQVTSYIYLTYKDKLGSDHYYLKIQTNLNMIHTLPSFQS